MPKVGRRLLEWVGFCPPSKKLLWFRVSNSFPMVINADGTPVPRSACPFCRTLLASSIVNAWRKSVNVTCLTVLISTVPPSLSLLFTQSQPPDPDLLPQKRSKTRFVGVFTVILNFCASRSAVWNGRIYNALYTVIDHLTFTVFRLHAIENHRLAYDVAINRNYVQAETGRRQGSSTSDAITWLFM